MRPDLVLGLGSEEARMLASNFADDLGSAVHYALETTHAIAVCPFHLDLTIRIGDDAAERGQGRRSEHRYLRFPDLRAECGVKRVHPKAMPVILTAAEEYDIWFRAPRGRSQGAAKAAS